MLVQSIDMILPVIGSKFTPFCPIKYRPRSLEKKRKTASDEIQFKSYFEHYIDLPFVVSRFPNTVSLYLR